jgi:hypothetical protein
MDQPQKVFCRPTTLRLRKLLMRVYQETAHVTEACQVAKVSYGTFYRWHGRSHEQGETNLEHFVNWATHPRPCQMPEALVPRAIELHQSHPSLGFAQYCPSPLSGARPPADDQPRRVQECLEEA